MADERTLQGVESSAIGLLHRAVEMDQKERFTEAVFCYSEGIKLLLDVVKATTDEKKKQHLRKNIASYMDRAETIKKSVEKLKESGKYHEQIKIESNSVGHSYEKIFGSYMDEALTTVEIEDPYIRNVHQIYNLLRFCELLVKHNQDKRGNVKMIRLLTGLESDTGQVDSQKNKLFQIKSSLQKFNINLTIEFSPTLHDREIRFNNGWIIKIGRGLDIYKPTETKFSIGSCDFSLRHCHETTIDIFHRKHTKTDTG
ncbi:MIT domain-containing protein 1-like [Tubulanus polymorphus]|uniref:MIT domain-containing protein 1-like n=1 Tax=Tubulanus polymorphus TaxID=672921 RepID=UPI003DA1F4F1